MGKKIMITAVSSILIGIGINGFIIPIQLINGGFWGVSLILHYLLGFKIAVTFLCLNTPIYIFAGFKDRDYFLNGLLGIIVSSVFVNLLTPLQTMFHLPVFAGILLGSILIGLGVGFMLKEHISPGGIDLLALLIAKIAKINVGIVLFLLDSMIISLGAITLKEERIVYSLGIVMIVGATTFLITSIKSIKVFV